MADDGSTKDDVKMPEGEIGTRIDKLYNVEEKDTSMFASTTSCGVSMWTNMR